MSAINGLEQAIANLNSISKTAVPVLLLRLLTGSRGAPSAEASALSQRTRRCHVSW
jgi:hypothetical protein